MMFQSAKAEIQPASSSRLSKPRLVKVRRQISSSRARSEFVEPQDSVNYPGPRSEKCNFMFGDDSNSVYGSQAAPQNATSFGNVKNLGSDESTSKIGIKTDFFVFEGSSDRCKVGESAAEKLPKEFQRLKFNYSGTEEKIQKSNNGGFVFNSMKTISDSIGGSDHGPGSLSFGSSGWERSDPDAGPSGRGSEGKLNDFLSQLDINDPANWNANLKFFATNPGAGVFEFQSMKTHSYDKENLDSVLPGEMRKLKIEVPEKDRGLNKTEGSYPSSPDGGNKTFSFVFGSKNGIGPPQMKAANPPEKIDSDKRVDSGSNESASRNLPEEIQRLKITDPENDDTTKNFNRDFVFSSTKYSSTLFPEDNISESFASGFSKNMDSKKFPHKAADQFASGDPSGMNSTYDQRSNEVLEESVARKLPEEIQKLKITESENDNNSGNTSSGGSFGFTLKSVSNPADMFVFGSKGKGSDPDSNGFGISSSDFNSLPTVHGNVSCSYKGSTAAVDIDNSSSKTEDSDYVSARSSLTSDGGKCFSSQSAENCSSNSFVFGSPLQKSKVHDLHEPPELHGADTATSKVADRDFESVMDGSDVFVCNSRRSETFAFNCDYSSGNTASVEPLLQSRNLCNQKANLGKPNIDENANPLFGYGGWGMMQENRSKREDPILGTCDPPSFLSSTLKSNKEVSNARARKRRGKLKESTSSFQKSAGASVREKISQGKSDMNSQGDYSPMDFSPCHVEGDIGEEYSREASVASEESIVAGSTNFSNEMNNSFSANDLLEDLAKDTMKSSNAEFSEAIAESGFTFSASSSAQHSVSSSKHIPRRKFRSKVGRNESASLSDPNAQLFHNLKEFSCLDVKKAQTEMDFHRKEHNSTLGSETKQESHINTIASSKSASNTIAQETCEKWRLMGNGAYATGDLCKAEEYYTLGVQSISPDETSMGCRRTLMLCYSNRAAARMSDGRIREALSDCKIATEIDPGFLRAQLRAASCHLLLGETEEACNHFKKCLHGGCSSSRDKKFVLEASDGLQKVKLISDCMDKASSLLQKGTTNDVETVLQIISEALLLSPYSESLIEMKAEALLMLRRYEELILLLDQTLESAKKNSFKVCNKEQEDNDQSRSTLAHAKLWRVYLKSRAYFYLGKLEEASVLMKDNRQLKAVAERNKSDSWALLSTTLSELLRIKVAGNTAFKSGKHLDAVEHYTSALTYNIESRPFTAVCFCNRAAAYQALGQITEAISDCSLAIALDPNYPKAISRRATLHEMIRDYSQAYNDLCKLICLLERNSEEKTGNGRPMNNGDDLDSARLRLSKMEEKSRKDIPLDMYKILGVEASADEAAIKKAYRKAALRHHPDKASQLLVRTENTDEKIWKEVAEEVHRDADKLFKMIGEAYAILSDPSKRHQYDTDEELRVLKERSHISRTSTTQPRYHRSYSSHYQRESDAWHRRYDSSNTEFSKAFRTGNYY